MKALITLILIVILGLLATLPFHYIDAGGGIKVFAKDHFTFENTYIDNSDIQLLIDHYNKGNFFEKIAMGNDPLFKKLQDNGYIKDKQEKIEKEADEQDQTKKQITDEQFQSELQERRTDEEKEIDNLIKGNSGIGEDVYKIENGSECAIDKGVIIITDKNNTSFGFTIKVINNSGYSGNISEKAIFTDKDKACFKGENDCKILFYFKENNRIEVIEGSCGMLYHGANICLSGTYTQR